MATTWTKALSFEILGESGSFKWDLVIGCEVHTVYSCKTTEERPFYLKYEFNASSESSSSLLNIYRTS